MSTTGDNLGIAIATAMFTPVSPAAAQLIAWKKFGNALVDNWITGSAILYGTDVPAPSLGNNGDFYIRRTTGIVEWYGPKTGGAWGTGISLIGPAGADGADGADGASFNPMGDWSISTSYVVFDFVTHEGSSYFSKTNHIGVEPPNATHWQLVAEKGDVGDIAALIHAATNLTPVADADEFPAVREVTGVWSLIKLKWSDIKAGVKAYCDGLYAALVHTHAAADILFERIGSAVYYTAQLLFNTGSSAGRITGGKLSAAVGPATGIDISAVEGVIGTSESAIGVKKPFTLAAGNVPLASFTDNAVNYIYIDYNVGSGVLSYAVTVDRLSLSHYTEFVLGRVFRAGTDLEFITTGMSINNALREDHERLMYRGIERMTGAVIAEKSTRYLTTTDGVFYLGRNKLEIDAKDTTGADRFSTFQRDGAGGWTETTGQQQVNNTQYDDGDGTLGTLTANRYGVHFAFVCNEGDIYLVYGQGDYTLAQAEAALLPASLPPYLVGFAVFAAKIIVKKSEANLYAVESAYANDFSSRSVPDHNDTGNLNSGDYQHLTAAEKAALPTDSADDISRAIRQARTMISGHL